jgi:hypothetical protein
VARKECRDLNLYVQEVDTQRSSKVDKGVIISQKPEAGFNAKIGRVIEVVVSAGPETVSVPSLFNLTVDEALKYCSPPGCAAARRCNQFSGQGGGRRIFFTDPATGTAVGRGARVNLYVSSGEMPSAPVRGWSTSVCWTTPAKTPPTTTTGNSRACSHTFQSHTLQQDRRTSILRFREIVFTCEKCPAMEKKELTPSRRG